MLEFTHTKWYYLIKIKRYGRELYLNEKKTTRYIYIYIYNKDKLKTGILLFSIFLILFSATYAYFKMQGDNGVSVPTQVTTNTTDSLVFETGKDIAITADMSNFGERMDNRTGESFARATLKANNKTNSASGSYNLFFIIESNELKYTTEDNKPELILKVTDPENNEITNIDGLSYKTVRDGRGNEISGFDLTTRTGGFKIAKDYDITTNKEITQTWNIEVVLVNLDSDQTSNGGKSLSGQLLITKSDYETYKLVHVNTAEANITTNSITTNLNIEEGTTEIDKYYFAIEEVETKTIVNPVVMKMGLLENENDTELKYYESNNSSYTFNNLKDNTLYKIYSYAIDKLGYKSNIYETEMKTEEYILPKIKNVLVTFTYDSISVDVISEEGTNEIDKYFFIKDNELYGDGQKSNIYTYSGLSEQTQYKIKIKIIDSEGRYSTEYIKDVTTKKKNLGNICQNREFGKCIADNYTKDLNIYYHTSSLSNSAGDNSYRYSESYEKVNNYICFGTNAATCDNNHLYRIIGVFGNQIKMIKADFATTSQLGTSEQDGTYTMSSYPNYKGTLTEIPKYYWSGSFSNKANSWAKSTLNTNALNTKFLKTFNTTWQSKIATTNWKVGGNKRSLIKKTNAPTTYTNEIINPVTGETPVNNKIGLMYVSDYMYAASPTYWTYFGYNDDTTKSYIAATGANWMYSGITEWTISRYSDGAYGAFFVTSTGNVSDNYVYGSLVVRPVFYLNSDVKLISGEGTSTDPFRIS